MIRRVAERERSPQPQELPEAGRERRLAGLQASPLEAELAAEPEAALPLLREPREPEPAQELLVQRTLAPAQEQELLPALERGRGQHLDQEAQIRYPELQK